MIDKTKYKQFTAVLLLVTFLIFAYNSLSVNTSSERSLVEGVIDLRETNDIYRLDGNWFFWENQILVSYQMHEKKFSNNNMIYVPGSWNENLLSSELPTGTGYGTYAIKLLVVPGSHIGIHIPNISTNYKLFVDEELIIEHGVVSRNEGEPLPLIKTHLVYFMPKSDEVLLVVQVSNFSNNAGGIIYPIVIGELSKMINFRSNALLQDIFLAASVLLYVVYHLILYLLGRRDKVMLWLILFSFSVIVLTIHLPANETLRTYLFPIKLWLSVTKTVYLLIVFLIVSFVKPIVLLYPDDSSKWMNKMIVIISLVLSVFVLITPPYELSLLLPIILGAVVLSIVIVLRCLLVAVRQKREGAVLELIGVVAIIVTSLFDFLINRQVIKSIDISLMPIGFLTFLVTTSYVITMKYTNSFFELKISNEALKRNQMQLIQQGQLASVGHLASGMAHEINNPLGYVKSNSTTLRDYLLELLNLYKEDAKPKGTANELDEKELKNKIAYFESDINEIHSDINNGILRIQNIINDLRAYSSIDETSDFKSISLNNTIELSSRLLKFSMKETIDLVLELDEIPHISVYGKEIGQVILNLILNASEAIQKKFGENSGGIVTIKTYVCNQNICIDIKDNGVGIETEKLGTIFQPFYSTKDIGQGLGLGLSISNEIILKHNGSIEVSSIPEQETLMTIKLPLNQKQLKK